MFWSLMEHFFIIYNGSRENKKRILYAKKDLQKEAEIRWKSFMKNDPQKKIIKTF